MKTPMNAFLLTVSLVALAAAPAAAQMNGSLNAADTSFLTRTAQGSVYEQTVAELGVSRAVSPMVQQYAQTLVLDHGSFNVQLLSLANRMHVDAPVRMSDDDRSRLSALMSKNGAAFDTAFLNEEARINAQDVDEETREISATQNPEMREFTTDIRNGDRFHLALARNLERAGA